MSVNPTYSMISNNCTNRIKPSLLRDVKTEALLVFARTALERYFTELDEAKISDVIEKNEEASYVYSTLKNLLFKLQESVVNVDYLLNLAQATKQYPVLKVLMKQEEPLMNYYDIMAQKVRSYYKERSAYLPELLVISALANWVDEEEKSTNIYPFLNEIDFLDLISKFEINREYFNKDNECKVSEILDLSCGVIQSLKQYKYKANKHRVSKSRKKK